MYSSSSPLPLFLFIFPLQIEIDFIVQLVIQALYLSSDPPQACHVWPQLLTRFFCRPVTRNVYCTRLNIYMLTIQGHLIPDPGPTHLGWLGGGSLEFTVVVWPRAPASLAPPASVFQLLWTVHLTVLSEAQTALLYLRTAAKQQLCKHAYTLTPGPRDGSDAADAHSDVLSRFRGLSSLRWSDVQKSLMSTEPFGGGWRRQWRVMERDQLNPNGL